MVVPELVSSESVVSEPGTLSILSPEMAPPRKPSGLLISPEHATAIKDVTARRLSLDARAAVHELGRGRLEKRTNLRNIKTTSGYTRLHRRKGRGPRALWRCR